MSDFLNFLSHKLLPKVDCDSSALDNYEAENLLSSSEAIRNRGFISYIVTKPPVSLTFDFICPVDISAICLCSSIGLQRCTGIEIFAKNSSNPNFISICKATYESQGLVFCNSRRYSKESPPKCYNREEQELFFFKANTWRLFTSAESIKVVIFRTARCVPCMKSIQVFGRVARNCSPTTKATISRLMEVKISNDNRELPKEVFKIPEDFVDALTCEIMALPMTLPCGKTIDRDTLEKHEENEKSFGRKPGDPFTGLKFTNTRKPIFNVSLKTRIDLFLLHNCDNTIISGVKRTLGSSSGGNSKRVKTDLDKKCWVCAEIDVLYRLPCDHIFCRSCLINLNLQCSLCKNGFLRKDVERFYV